MKEVWDKGREAGDQKVPGVGWTANTIASVQGLYNPLSCHFKSPDDCPCFRHLIDTPDEEEMESGRGEKTCLY